MKKWVYLFEEGYREIPAERRRDLLGGKGAGLAEMAGAGLPVPPGFTITTEACNAYFAAGRQFPEGLWEQVLEALHRVEEKVGRRFGDPQNPLLVSVRSGAKFSMPGMMDTVLNVGLTDETVKGLIAQTGDERFAYDAYRRLIQMFGRIVKGIPGERFEHILDRYKAKTKGKQDTDLTAEMLRDIVEEFKALYRKELEEEFPQDPLEQLRQAIRAVFDSWFGKRAVDYRNFYKIPHDLGTACNVQTMVFGNMGFDSATGVAFTRNPATGEKELYGEYLPNAQGEDVVAGIRTPLKITKKASQEWAREHGISEEERRLRYPSLEELMPETYRQFLEVAALLERHYRDVQDLEFTIERGRLWMLQTRTGKRTAKAAVKIAVDMVHEGLITKEEAVMRVEPEQINQLLLPRFDEKAKERAREKGDLLARGLNASPGAATGHAVFDADTAEAWGRDGRPVILVRPETTPDDVHGMIAARGILTQRGGATSHAAVVARGLGKPAVVGCEALQIDLERKQFSVNGRVIREGDFISIDGSTGEVFAGQIPTIDPNLAEERELAELLSWADEFRRLQVWANADYPRDARKAREFGAEGIGLARTEHMFFETDRLPYVRQMILNAPEAQRLMDQLRAAQQAAQARPDDPKAQKALREAERAVRASKAVKAYRKALDRLLPVQRKDFEGLFEAMDGLPVIIRLIDPPMHEFLPRYEELLAEVVELRTRIEERRKIKGYRPRKGEKSIRQMEEELAEKEALLRAVNALREMNPMLGLRGVRLGILYPDIIRLQVRAILEAACHVKRRGITPRPEIMIPLSADVKELQIVREIVDEVAREVTAREGVEIEYKFGTMIEVPRAALLAGEIAQVAEFFSFGTNDLTQTVWAISRDDAEGKFLLRYLEEKIVPENPFQVLDRKGVGRLMRMAVEEGRRTRPDLEVGICGEHGGDPSSIEFCHEIGLNYVSASPYRVPVARLAAAQAALKERAARIETR